MYRRGLLWMSCPAARDSVCLLIGGQILMSDTKAGFAVICLLLLIETKIFQHLLVFVLTFKKDFFGPNLTNLNAGDPCVAKLLKNLHCCTVAVWKALSSFSSSPVSLLPSPLLSSRRRLGVVGGRERSASYHPHLVQ